ncbi:MAG: hypothetical protein LBC64_05700 [Fibromonadaceae bacterium]|jgi:hypothetical protein|nr:hypothetical protein [Fibromonadaceae bacterium]
MKKRCFYFALLALSAFFAFLAACGEGEPFNLTNSNEWRQIQSAVENVTDTGIPACYEDHNVGPKCPEGGIVVPEPPLPPQPPVTPSSSSSEPTMPPQPGTSSQSTGTSSAGGISSAGGTSSAGGVSSSAAGSSSSFALACGSVAQSITSGSYPTLPSVTCSGANVLSNQRTFTPNIAAAVNATVSNVTVRATGGNCSGQEAPCAGTITVNAAPSSSSTPPATQSSSSAGGSNPPNPGGGNNVTLNYGETYIFEVGKTYNLTCEKPARTLYCYSVDGSAGSVTVGTKTVEIPGWATSSNMANNFGTCTDGQLTVTKNIGCANKY